MRLKIATFLSKLLFFLAGSALLTAGIFATQLGIDNDPGWGKGRLILTLLGAVFLSVAAAIQCWQRVRVWITRLDQWIEQTSLLRAARKLKYGFQSLPPVAALRCHPQLSAAISAGLGVLITVFIYVWYMTNGTITTWSGNSTYFDRLANAFLAGQVSLLETPSPELLAMENPYDWRQRETIPQIWDASLYQDRYYLYWGPVPGLVAAGIKAVAPVKVGDQYILLLFCTGLVVVQALILSLIRSEVYPDAPPWTLLPLVLLGGLSIPVFWLVNKPHVYETAIAGGQFFLILGFYAALKVLVKPQNAPRWLALAGLAWGAALNCRINLVLAIAFFCGILAVILYRRAQGLGHWSRQMAWLALPLLLWVGGLGWYNFARFGSPFETGHRYQLTGPALPSDYTQVTSPAYILPGLYNYLARPLEINPGEFPFIFAPFIKETDWPFFIRLPENYYYSEPVTGLPLAVPAVLLSLFPLVGVLNSIWRWLQEEKRTTIPRHSSFPGWLWALLAGGAACLFAPLLVFISNSMRYLADVMPMLALLSASGFWWGLCFFRDHSKTRFFWVITAVALILVSVGLSLLLNFP